MQIFSIEEDINSGDYVDIRFKLKVLSNKYLKYQFNFEIQTLIIITKEEADAHLNAQDTTYFVHSNLKNIIKNTSQEMIYYLQSYANQKGFNLVRKHSINEPRIKLFCHHHCTGWSKSSCNMPFSE